MPTRSQQVFRKKNTDNHLGLHPLDFTSYKGTTFALEEALHEVNGDVFRQSRQRLRTNSFLARPADGGITKGTKLAFVVTTLACPASEEKRPYTAALRVRTANMALISSWKCATASSLATQARSH